MVIFIGIGTLNLAFATAPSIENAPLEWLVAQSLMLKTNEDGHVVKDKLTKKIFEVTNYDPIKDELRISIKSGAEVPICA